MSEKHVFGLARPQEGAAVLGLFADLFPVARQAWVPLGCPGALAYVQDTIERQGAGGDNVWFVARDGGVAGAAEIRRSPEALFLNHVLVRRDLQGRGLGRRLLAEGFARLRGARTREISLDVFADNARARGWYERLGFRVVASTRWELAGLPATSGTAGWFVSGLAQADCVQARYGFSMFDLHTPAGQYHVGRLGSDWFRVADARLVDDAVAGVALSALGPGRRVLLLRRVAPEAEAAREQPDANLLALGYRMSAPLDDTLRALRGEPS
ncbi:MAG: GNAT family N-acetyltransferase [Verrucomicrobiales bacterium]|nr:GNAT family N-acetyltransferase [Verrucomicrobiales bacterium]